MAEINETIRGRITDFDEKRNEVVIRAPYTDFATMCRREYKEVEIRLIDSRRLSPRQRKSCYAMINEIAAYMGEIPNEAKDFLKLSFWTEELQEKADELFSLSNAPMSIVAAFQKWLARFIVRHEIPCKVSLLSYVDDVEDYVYSCLCYKKCAICGRQADLHHVDAVGMGADRTEIIHEGMRVLPLWANAPAQAAARAIPLAQAVILPQQVQCTQKRILMIVGSLRESSLNLHLAQEAAALLRERAEIRILDYAGLPWLDQDADFPPAEVQRVRTEVFLADGLWFFTPEYHCSYPGVLKNLLDWLSISRWKVGFPPGTVI